MAGIVPDLGETLAPLGKLGEIYRAAQQRNAREQALKQLGSGSGSLDYANTARALLAAGDTEGGLSLARLAESATERARQQQNSDRSFGLQEKQFDLTKRTAEAGLEGNKVPAGFERNPAGGLRPIKGGPEDPERIREVTEAKDKGKQFNAGEITKLVEEGGKFSNLSNFATTFQDRFAGYKVPGVGNAAMAAGRYVPGAVGMIPGLNEADVKEGAQWWQGYDRYKNVVRNELFGSALTATEQAAFERADVSPAMDPGQIRKNLETQQSILKDAMRRKAGALVAGGYQPEPIARAYGLKLEDLGVNTTKKGAQLPPALADKAKQAPDGNYYIPDPNRPGKYLKVTP